MLWHGLKMVDSSKESNFEATEQVKVDNKCQRVCNSAELLYSLSTQSGDHLSST